MKPKNTFVIFFVIFLSLVVFAVLSKKSTDKTLTPELNYPTLSVDTEKTKNWDTYKNEKYQFEIKHPKNSTVAISDTGVSDYIRIQNYSGNMPPNGGYYLEIYVYDHNLKRKEQCPGLIKDYEQVQIKPFVGYRGGVVGGGEAASYIQGLCVNASNIDVYLQVSENSNNVSNDIVNSFRFIR